MSADNEPRIKASLVPDNDGIRIRLINDGWAAAENLHIHAKSKTGSLEEYFGASTIDVNVPTVDKASDTEIRFLFNSDLIKQGSEEFELTLSASDDNHDEVHLEAADTFFFVKGGKLDLPYGKGGPSHNVYGVKIDTSSGSFSYEEDANECVKPGENICIPVCFFPDQSCTMKVRLAFDVVKGDTVETLSTDVVELHILVPSIYNDHSGVDMTDQDAMATAMRLFGVVDRRETAMSYPLSEANVF